MPTPRRRAINAAERSQSGRQPQASSYQPSAASRGGGIDDVPSDEEYRAMTALKRDLDKRWLGNNRAEVAMPGGSGHRMRAEKQSDGSIWFTLQDSNATQCQSLKMWRNYPERATPIEAPHRHEYKIQPAGECCPGCRDHTQHIHAPDEHHHHHEESHAMPSYQAPQNRVRMAVQEGTILDLRRHHEVIHGDIYHHVQTGVQHVADKGQAENVTIASGAPVVTAERIAAPRVSLLSWLLRPQAGATESRQLHSVDSRRYRDSQPDLSFHQPAPEELAAERQLGLPMPMPEVSRLPVRAGGPALAAPAKATALPAPSASPKWYDAMLFLPKPENT